MRRPRNKGCVYTGDVGRQMPLIHRVKRGRRVSWMKVTCVGGPLMDKIIQLDKFGDCTTLVFRIGNDVGQYRMSRWHPE